MASTGSRTDPYLAFRFQVRLDDLAVGGFSDCGGLQVETEVQDYPEGGLNTYVHKLVGRTKQTNLILKKGIVDRLLWDWYDDLTRGRVRFRNGAITVRDSSGQDAVMVWEFRHAIPVKWTGPELNAAQSSIAVETVELAHEGLERRQ